MAHIIATDSCHSQQLIRAAIMNIVQPMVANTKKDFADRLNLSCDNAKPPVISGRGRRAELKRRVYACGLTVSGESVRKWLSDESIPSMDNVRFIAIALGVEADWLLTGRAVPDHRQADYDVKSAAQVLELNEPAASPFLSARQRHIQEIVELLSTINDYGVVIVRDKAKDMSLEFPVDLSQTGS
jgi:transcriptional regulator with XRE-family HTH domain